MGAARIAPWQPNMQPPDPGHGRRLLRVISEHAAAGAATEAARSLGVCCVRAEDLVYAAVMSDTAPLHRAVEAFTQAQHQAQCDQLAVLDEEAAAGGTQGTGELGGGGGGADDEQVEEGEGIAEVTLLEVAVGAPRRRAASGGGGAATTAVAATHAAPSPRTRRSQQQGTQQQGVASSPTKGRAGGRKRGAAAVAGVQAQSPADAAATAAQAPASKRARKGASKAGDQGDGVPELDSGAPVGAHIDQQQRSQQQLPQQQRRKGGGGAPLGAGPAPPSALRQAVLYLDLVANAGGAKSSAAPVSSSNSGVSNFKAFRRKGQAAALQAAAPRIPLVIYEDAQRNDADAQAFAKCACCLGLGGASGAGCVALGRRLLQLCVFTPIVTGTPFNSQQTMHTTTGRRHRGLSA